MNSQEIKQLQELQNAYLSVYEAKKVDQDKDGDNDFADVRIARMIASGVSKEEAIRRVKDKEYNEEYDLILSHLLDEGYAETPEAAESIMVNMSEEWKQSIVETNAGPSTPVKIDPKMGVVPNLGAGRVGKVRIKPNLLPDA